MTLDPRARRLLDMLAMPISATAPPMSAQARRDSFSTLMQLADRPFAVGQTRDICAIGPGGPLQMRLYDPRAIADAPAPGMVYFHGGGLVAGSLDTHDGLCRRLAAASGAVVFAIDYRLAPEAKFPACLDDAAFAVDWVASQTRVTGVDNSRLAIGGDSAGAMLAALISSGYKPVRASLKAQLLLCPVIDLAGNYPSRQEFGKGFLIDSDMIERDIQYCLPEGMDPSKLPSPLRVGVSRSSPPSIIDAAECDPFRDEAETYAQRLSTSGVAVDYTCHAGMLHVFHGLCALLPQAEPAIAAAGQKLARLLAA